MPDYTITEADVVEAAATPARLVDDQDDEDAMRVPTRTSRRRRSGPRAGSTSAAV
jgi:hypothetical protein